MSRRRHIKTEYRIDKNSDIENITSESDKTDEIEYNKKTIKRAVSESSKSSKYSSASSSASSSKSSSASSSASSYVSSSSTSTSCDSSDSSCTSSCSDSSCEPIFIGTQMMPILTNYYQYIEPTYQAPAVKPAVKPEVRPPPVHVITSAPESVEYYNEIIRTYNILQKQYADIFNYVRDVAINNGIEFIRDDKYKIEPIQITSSNPNNVRNLDKFMEILKQNIKNIVDQTDRIYRQLREYLPADSPLVQIVDENEQKIADHKMPLVPKNGYPDTPLNRKLGDIFAMLGGRNKKAKGTVGGGPLNNAEQQADIIRQRVDAYKKIIGPWNIMNFSNITDDQRDKLSTLMTAEERNYEQDPHTTDYVKFSKYDSFDRNEMVNMINRHEYIEPEEFNPIMEGRDELSFKKMLEKIDEMYGQDKISGLTGIENIKKQIKPLQKYIDDNYGYLNKESFTFVYDVEQLADLARNTGELRTKEKEIMELKKKKQDLENELKHITKLQSDKKSTDILVKQYIKTTDKNINDLDVLSNGIGIDSNSAEFTEERGKYAIIYNNFVNRYMSGAKYGEGILRYFTDYKIPPPIIASTAYESLRASKLNLRKIFFEDPSATRAQSATKAPGPKAPAKASGAKPSATGASATYPDNDVLRNEVGVLMKKVFEGGVKLFNRYYRKQIDIIIINDDVIQELDTIQLARDVDALENIDRKYNKNILEGPEYAKFGNGIFPHAYDPACVRNISLYTCVSMQVLSDLQTAVGIIKKYLDIINIPQYISLFRENNAVKDAIIKILKDNRTLDEVELKARIEEYYVSRNAELTAISIEINKTIALTEEAIRRMGNPPSNEQLTIEKIDTDKLKIKLDELRRKLVSVQDYAILERKYIDIMTVLYEKGRIDMEKNYNMKDLKNETVLRIPIPEIIPEDDIHHGGTVVDDYMQKITNNKNNGSNSIDKIYDKIEFSESLKRDIKQFESYPEYINEFENAILFTYHVLNSAIELCGNISAEHSIGNEAGKIQYCQIKMIKNMEYEKIIAFKSILSDSISATKLKEPIDKLKGSIKKTIKFITRLQTIAEEQSAERSRSGKKPLPVYVQVDIKKNSCIPLIITQALMFYLSK